MALSTDNLPQHSWLELCLKLEAGFLPSDMTVGEAMVLARAGFAERNGLEEGAVEIAKERGIPVLEIQGYFFVDYEEDYEGVDRLIFNSLKACQAT